jgi:hypothetical protein
MMFGFVQEESCEAVSGFGVGFRFWTVWVWGVCGE